MRDSTKKTSPWTVLSVTTLGSLLASVQGSALVLSLPDVMLGLKADFLTLLWVLLGYLLTSTALVPLIGRLSDLYGRRRFYNAGFLVFTVASVLGGFTQPAFHGWDLVAARVLQGLGGALLFANSTALVTDAFGKERVGLALGINQIALAAGFVLGPLVGGALTAIDWRWVFWFNGPLGLIGVWWGWSRLPVDHGEKEGGPFDVKGTVFFLLGLVGLLLSLSLLALPGVSLAAVAGCAAVGAVGLGLFARIEAKAAHPFLHLELFTTPRLALPNLAAALNALARGAVLFLLTFFLQGPYGLSPFWAGMATAPFGLAFMVAGPLSGLLADRWKPALLSTGGLLVSAVGLLGLGFVTESTPYTWLVVFMVLMGAGSGLFNTPNITQVMSRVDARHRGVTSATRVLLVNGGQMVSLAVVFPFVLSRMPEDLMAKIFLYGGGMAAMPVVEASLLDGIRLAFLFSFALTLVAALVSALGYAKKEDAAGEITLR
jgi:MFS family permease